MVLMSSRLYRLFRKSSGARISHGRYFLDLLVVSQCNAISIIISSIALICVTFLHGNTRIGVNFVYVVHGGKVHIEFRSLNSRMGELNG